MMMKQASATGGDTVGLGQRGLLGACHRSGAGRRARQVTVVPIAATKAAASSQERLTSRPDTAQKPNAQASHVVLILIITSFPGAVHPYLTERQNRAAPSSRSAAAWGRGG
jgi:hypothetical protein